MTLFSKNNQILFLITILFTITTTSWAKDTITLSNAWVADAPPNSTMYAGYLDIKNSGNKTIELESVSSPAFKTVEIHQTQIIKNIARMVEQDGLPIFENETTKFAPGGYHLMMIKPTSAIKLGDKIKITLKFENNVTKSITAKVQKRK